MNRADNDIPRRLAEDNAERMRVFFQGHDGIFFLHKDHPQFNRLGDVLRDAIKAKAEVWFVADGLLFLLDVVKAKERAGLQ